MNNRRKKIVRVLVYFTMLSIFISQMNFIVYAENVCDFQIVDLASEESEHKLNNNGGLVDTYFPAGTRCLSLENSKEQEIIKRFSGAMESYQTQFNIYDLNIAYSQSVGYEITNLLDQFLNSNPQYFYINYAYMGNTINGICNEVNIIYLSDYKKYGTIDVEKIEHDQTIINASVNRALSTVNDSMTTVEKALAIHEWIIRECDYDYINYLKMEAGEGEVPASSYSIIGVLRDGIAVCQGYAETYSMLMNKLGIESYIVTSRSMNHAWNMILIDGNWYHVDATWDDPVFGKSNEDYINEGYTQHIYFLKSDSEMNNLNHYGWSDDLPKCTDDGSYSGYLFRTYLSVPLSYYDGYWYFNKYNYIARNTISGDGEADTRAIYNSIRGFVFDNNLYYSTYETVYQIDLDDFLNSQPVEVLSIKSVYPGYRINEFVIKRNEIIVNAYKNEGEESYSFVHLLKELNHTHSWMTGEVTLQPTCTEKGIISYICSICGEVKTDEILPQGHVEVIDNGIEATCTRDGKTQGSHCSVCGQVLVPQETIPAVGNHSWGEWIETKAATSNESGTEIRKCCVCGERETRSIPVIRTAAWIKSGNRWWYRHADGSYTKNGWEKISGVWYHFDASGWMDANKWIGDYYVKSDGAMATNQWIGNYYVGADGKWIPGYSK